MTPILSYDLTCLFFNVSPFPSLVFFPLLFMIHLLLVGSLFSHDLAWRQNEWYSKPSGLLQNMTYCLYNIWFRFYYTGNNSIILCWLLNCCILSTNHVTLGQCMPLKKLNSNIVYRISMILHFTTICNPIKRAGLLSTFQTQWTLPELRAGLP
jgi:hypothetical protein